jgi:hypothetical protein
MSEMREHERRQLLCRRAGCFCPEEDAIGSSELVDEARAFVKADLRTSRTGSGGRPSRRASIVERLADEVERLRRRDYAHSVVEELKKDWVYVSFPVPDAGCVVKLPAEVKEHIDNQRVIEQVARKYFNRLENGYDALTMHEEDCLRAALGMEE